MRRQGLEQEVDHAVQVESALYLNELQFRRLLDNLPAGAYTCDAEGLITYFNDHAVQLWGRAPKLNDPVDRFCGSFKLLADDGSPIAHDRCWMALALKMEQEYNGQEIVIERPDGQRRTALAHANPIHDEFGKLLGAVNVLVDITERKQAEALLAHANEVLEKRVRERTAELEALNAELESFNYSVSHDLRAPLRGIDGFSLALLEDYGHTLDASARHYLERIRAGVARMGGLIDDLLNLSRLTRGQIKPQKLNLSELARLSVEDLRAREPTRKLTVKIEDGLRAYGDEALMRIALDNLLENAWKFTRHEEEGRIEVRADARRGETIFVVQDNGVGFDMNHAKKLFRPFQRLPSPDEFEGTGIGLAIVQRIVHKHGGRIWALAEAGKGATFGFTLPTDPR